MKILKIFYRNKLTNQKFNKKKKKFNLFKIIKSHQIVLIFNQM